MGPVSLVYIARSARTLERSSTEPNLPICRSNSDDVRAGRQPQDSQGAWPNRPAFDPRPRRRGHRVTGTCLKGRDRELLEQSFLNYQVAENNEATAPQIAPQRPSDKSEIKVKYAPVPSRSYALISWSGSAPVCNRL